jgi:hypothetical protein
MGLVWGCGVRARIEREKWHCTRIVSLLSLFAAMVRSPGRSRVAGHSSRPAPGLLRPGAQVLAVISSICRAPPLEEVLAKSTICSGVMLPSILPTHLNKTCIHPQCSILSVPHIDSALLFYRPRRSALATRAACVHHAASCTHHTCYLSRAHRPLRSPSAAPVAHHARPTMMLAIHCTPHLLRSPSATLSFSHAFHRSHFHCGAHNGWQARLSTAAAAATRAPEQESNGSAGKDDERRS